MHHDEIDVCERFFEFRNEDLNEPATIEGSVPTPAPRENSSGSSGRGGGGGGSTPTKNNQSGSSGSSSGGGRSGKPVLMDLNGNGLTLTDRENSNLFLDIGGDGYKRRSSWVGAGDGVLMIDADGDGKISERKEIVFTDGIRRLIPTCRPCGRCRYQWQRSVDAGDAAGRSSR